MAMVFCRGCGKEIHETAVTCPQCGFAQVTAPPKDLKNQTTATVLSAFLGGFGAHRFYLGNTVLGVFYLLFFWTYIPALIATVETFVFAFKSPQAWARDHNGGRLSEPVHGLVKGLVLFIPVIVIIGILAAIAIPAYQGYVRKQQTVLLETHPAPVQTKGIA